MSKNSIYRLNGVYGGPAYKIPSSKSKPTEFECQAELYFRLKELGLDVRGEVTWRHPQKINGRRESCRFDLVIYSGDEAIEIIEVKNGSWSNNQTRQHNKYPKFGKRVTWVYGMSGVKQYIQELKRDGRL